jgi:hypothetical protein
VPSSRQKFKLSSAYVRLHVRHCFMRVLRDQPERFLSERVGIYRQESNRAANVHAAN